MPSSMRTPEYDAFGPWVYEVTSPDDVPPLFRDHPLDEAVIVLKVPRPITRRDAHPRMHLYDHLLVLGPTSLTVLTRTGTTYRTDVVQAEDVAAVVDSVDLLDARLVVHRRRGSADRGPAAPVAVRYNGSSHDVVAPLLRALRGMARGEAVAPSGPSPEEAPAGSGDLGLTDLGEADVALVTTYREILLDDPATALLAAERRTPVRPGAPGPAGALARLIHLAWGMTLQGLVVLGRPGEVELVHRRHWWVRGRRPVHSIARTAVPLRAVDEVTTRDHQRYAGVLVVDVRAGASRLEVPVAAGSAAAAVLPAALRSR